MKSHAAISAISTISAIALPLLLGMTAIDARADDKGGYSREYKGDKYKEKYWDGPCKVKREWKKNGEYKEERKCKDRRVEYPRYGDAYYQQGPAVVISPQVIIRP